MYKRQPNGLAINEEQALAAASKLSYPVLVRPSFVLGGRAMQIVYSDKELCEYMRSAVEASPERPILVDKFLEDAIEAVSYTHLTLPTKRIV